MFIPLFDLIDLPGLRYVDLPEFLHGVLKKKEFEKGTQGGRRPNQGGRRPNSRIPKALQKPAPQPKQEEKKPEVKEITLPEKMTIRELAEEP